MTGRAGLRALLGVLVLGLGLTGGVAGPAAGGAAPATVAPTATVAAALTAASTAGCPTSRRRPDPQRPQVSLDFRIGDRHRQVTGSEHVVFRPDRPVDRLVFRLTANSSYLVRQGTSVRVTAASASPAGAGFRFARAGAAASSQGGLLIIPLTRSLAAGTRVTADVRFVITLGPHTGDRIGRSGGYAWFGSAQPLLAWQRGYGWHTEAMIPFPAETATSEAADTRLTVSAPAADAVVATGRPVRPVRVGARRVWRARALLARDVSVAAGPFRIVDRTVGRATLRIGAPSRAAARPLATEFTRAMDRLAGRFGAYPFGSLSVARLPGSGGGGIEYPSAIQMFDADSATAVHETAHQWFYGMLGDSQSLHPWLDEAFAEYAQRLVDGDPEPREYLSANGIVDRPIQDYGTDAGSYFFVTYAKGAATLEAARSAAGGAAWDSALRCYVRANAWRVVVPADLRRALAAFPRSIAILRRAGALH